MYATRPLSLCMYTSRISISQLKLNVNNQLLTYPRSEKENAEVRITDPDQYQSIVDAEWKIIYDKLDLCVNVGSKVILSRLPIGRHTFIHTYIHLHLINHTNHHCR